MGPSLPGQKRFLVKQCFLLPPGNNLSYCCSPYRSGTSMSRKIRYGLYINVKPVLILGSEWYMIDVGICGLFSDV